MAMSGGRWFMASGLIEEVRQLHERSYGWELPSMSSLGYIQFKPYFAGEATLAECIQRLKYDTHAFARRQERWFRRLSNVIQLAADSKQ